MKLTYINFQGSMYANSKKNYAKFLDNVRVLDMPCENPNIEIDLDAILDHLPEGAMYLHGAILEVYDHGDKTKSQKEMIAKGNVTAQSREFTALCDTMTYNEAKDQIIFEGGPGGVATLNKIKQRGRSRRRWREKRLFTSAVRGASPSMEAISSAGWN